jgi:hypothetical protein
MNTQIMIVLLVLVILLIVLKKFLTPNPYPYEKLDALFTPAERSFLHVLQQAVAQEVHVFGKVRVADVLTPHANIARSHWQRAFNKISAKHFDYVLCDKNNLSVLCVIELNDRSHNTRIRKKRDHFLEKSCQAAHLPLVQIRARASYNPEELQQTLSPYLQKKVRKKAPKKQKTCPKCSAPLLQRVAKNGKYKGKKFLACSSYPECRYLEGVG